MKKVSIIRFFIYYASFSIFANVAHPITPTLFTNIGYPDYMFGVSFAAMAFSIFLFSPLWGKIGDDIGHDYDSTFYKGNNDIFCWKYSVFYV